MKSLLAIITAVLLLSFTDKKEIMDSANLYGAWETNIDIEGKNARAVKIITPKYSVTSVYTKTEYLAASGVTWELKSGKLMETFEFNTTDPELVGITISVNIVEKGDVLETEFEGQKLTWKRIDDGKSDLAGAWRITGRERNGEISQMQLGPRKTFKILSGTRFQWAAYNVETKQFSGSGGGTYTLKDGKYTEQIEVFSRDNSRVGASLEFDYEVKGKEWHHSGLSSKGSPIYEIWTNQDN